ncbi:hypothetical protein [Aquimarina sp. MMG016]|uniref:hypothetical protein n=1 Tax=Aquimarina sp. MMG016 TaxID=2822690 RepID=UPI001B3A29F7|nr:hypothetical protein [Aquimarina sp. MMG016]MBQ4822680.1 hypothetical protein [Aquimarina sp. MMG016]
MKKLSIWSVMIFTLLIGFNSCDQIEEFDNCPEVNVTVDNETGSAVYRFAAQIDGIEDVRFTWTINGDEVDTGSLSDVKDQILDYRFEPGEYKVCVKVASENCPIEVCTDIVVERDETDPCPDLFFESRQYERPSQYKFIADFRGIEEVSYGWFINGEFVEDSSPNESNYLIYDFKEPGVYEVCIATETPECPNGTRYCKEIVIEEVSDVCPEVSFTKEMEPGTNGVYVFEAQIEGTDAVAELDWYINDQLIENPSDQQGGSRVLTYQFDPGVYKVCLKVFTEDCPEGVIYCKEIEVRGENECPELFFIAEKDGDNPAYYFQVEFENASNIEWLGWYINGEFVEDSNNGDNNRFYYQFSPGRYEVCLKTETPECPEGTSYCKVIEIEDPVSCPDLFFEMEQEGNTPGYNFYASFDGMQDTSFWWTINGDVVDEEMVGPNDDKDNYMYYQFGPGTYEICIETETPNCPQGIKYCKTLVIE